MGQPRETSVLRHVDCDVARCSEGAEGRRAHYWALQPSHFHRGWPFGTHRRCLRRVRAAYPRYWQLGALASGCAAVVKMPEQMPHFSALFAELVPQYLDKDLYRVVNGAVPETTKVGCCRDCSRSIR